MSKQIDYYFSMISPWAHMGHARFIDIARRHTLEVRFKPAPLHKVFAETGGLPLLKRAPARQRYRLMELQRWREKLKMPFHLRPKYGRFDPALADRFVLAISAAGHDPEPFVRRGFKAVQEDEMNLADETVLVQLADELGLPGAQLLKRARSSEIQAQYEQNYQDAVAADAIGSPCYVRGGEVFWGQDRLDLFEDAVTSGRAPFRSDV
jgi:2-hydroxychromene-2-carboxylate isomerase